MISFSKKRNRVERDEHEFPFHWLRNMTYLRVLRTTETKNEEFYFISMKQTGEVSSGDGFQVKVNPYLTQIMDTIVALFYLQIVSGVKFITLGGF
jgi:hypothetical protein